MRTKSFPLPSDVQDAFIRLKEDIPSSVFCSINESIPFVIEMDASDIALAATLNQAGKPVTFLSRTLNEGERKHSAVEKEAYAIVEAVRKWRHYLAGQHFTLITDQKSVTFMFDTKRPSSIKNSKIMRWRIELADYHFDIQYRPGTENIPADTLSRVYCATISIDTLTELYEKLCHPGVTRMMHLIRIKKLPFSVEDVRNITARCFICAECKPKFYKSQQSFLIKAIRPSLLHQPISICLQLLMNSLVSLLHTLAQILLLTLSLNASQLFAIFGMPAYIHSDRGTSFVSADVKQFLHNHGISSSRTTPFNPQGNGQCERYNGIIWKAVTMTLKSHNLPISHWKSVLPDALYSVRSLLCTATNSTAHERLFTYQRQSTNGHYLPSWLTTPGPIVVKQHVQHSKYEPTVN